MFPTTITITISSPEQLALVVSALNHMSGTAPLAYPSIQAPAPKPKAEKTATPAAKAEAAPGQPTVEGAAADAAQEKTAAEPTRTAQSAEAEQQASTAAEFPYTKLAAAVNAAFAKHGKEALQAVAVKHGAPTFKLLPASAWQAAYDDVVALG